MSLDRQSVRVIKKKKAILAQSVRGKISWRHSNHHIITMKKYAIKNERSRKIVDSSKQFVANKAVTPQHATLMTIC